MGIWLVPADLLARSRFVVSPLSETTAALLLLNGDAQPRLPWQRAFRNAHREAYAEMLACDPRRVALAGSLTRRRRGATPAWIADFIAPPPLEPGATFEDELEQVLAWDDDRVRGELRSIHGRVPAGLGAGGLAQVAADLLAWVWSATVASDWPRRRRVLEADVVSRTQRLATRGWSSVVETLGAQRRWLDDGRLQINDYDSPGRDLSQATQLSFVPVHSHGPYVAWDPPHRYAIVYPVAGAQAAADVASPSGLARLVGSNRARVLVLLDSPRSTTQLAALSDLPLGSVGNHLRVLLDAGAVVRRRAGREVLYWRTPLGDALVATTR